MSRNPSISLDQPLDSFPVCGQILAKHARNLLPNVIDRHVREVLGASELLDPLCQHALRDGNFVGGIGTFRSRCSCRQPVIMLWRRITAI